MNEPKSVWEFRLFKRVTNRYCGAESGNIPFLFFFAGLLLIDGVVFSGLFAVFLLRFIIQKENKQTNKHIIYSSYCRIFVVLGKYCIDYEKILIVSLTCLE